MPRPRLPIPDAEIIRMNGLGYSMGTISDTYKCHPSTIAKRLFDMGIDPADTRRTFMEDVLRLLTPDQIEWVESYISPSYQIKHLLVDLIKTGYMATKEPK